MVMVIVASLLGLLAAFMFFISRRQTKGTTKISKSQSIQKDLRTYTKAEVSKHNSRRDCWIIVKDKIYDVTPYVEEHPGGDAILNHAGGDSTEGFYGPQHATRVFDMIDEFYVGDLKTKTPQSFNKRYTLDRDGIYHYHCPQYCCVCYCTQQGSR